MSEATPLLAVDGIRKTYRGITAVDGVSFTVGRGRIVGIIGPNGSGKSTTIDCITGFQPADAGRVRLDGQDLAGLAAWRIARAGMTRTFQTVRLYDQFTLHQNLQVALQSWDGTGWLDAVLRTVRLRSADRAAAERARELTALIGLERYADVPVSILSYGQKKLVALAAALMSRPKLVVLDEPVAGVNPTRVREIESAIRVLRDEGVTFLVVEHNMQFIMNLCDHVIVIDQGRKLVEGTPAAIHADARVLEAYLGVRV